MRYQKFFIAATTALFGVCAAWSSDTPTDSKFNITVDSPTQVTRGTRNALRRSNTLWGPTGLIFVPTAYTTDRNNFSVGAGFTKDFASASVNYGLIQDVEVGVTYLDRQNDLDSRVLANAKVRIVPANFNWLEVGIGMMDIADALDQSLYIVGSADLIVPDEAAERGAIGLRVHAGIGTGYFNEKPFAGGELFLTKGFSIVGEWDTKNVNAALRYTHSDEFYAEAGNYGNRPMFKISYTLRF